MKRAALILMLAVIGCEPSHDQTEPGRPATTSTRPSTPNIISSPLVGLWEGAVDPQTGATERVDFTPTGQVILIDSDLVLAGRWRFDGGNRIAVEMAVGEAPETRIWTWRLGEEGLILEDQNLWTRHLRRAPPPGSLDRELFGAWTNRTSGEAVEYTPHGTVLSRTPRGDMAGTWTIGQGRVLLELSTLGQRLPFELGYVVEDGRLHLTDPSGQVSSYDPSRGS